MKNSYGRILCVEQENCGKRELDANKVLLLLNEHMGPFIFISKFRFLQYKQ